MLGGKQEKVVCRNKQTKKQCSHRAGSSSRSRTGQDRLQSTQQDCFLHTTNFKTQNILKCVFKAVKNTGTPSSLVPCP